MKMIAAVDSNWGIGRKNSLLVSIPSDMKFFRETTSGCTIIMGRRTLESFPGGKPLKNRRNIVLTSDTSYQAEGAQIVHSVDGSSRDIENNIQAVIPVLVNLHAASRMCLFQAQHTAAAYGRCRSQHSSFL